MAFEKLTPFLYHQTIAELKGIVYLVSMTPYEFKALPEEEQAKAICHGDFFLYRENFEHTILLYKVYDFYVEVYYCNESNEIVSYNPFTSKEKLEVYFHRQLN